MDNCIPGITLGSFVDQYMIATFNDKRAYYINYLYHAKLAWRKIFWNTVFRVKNVSLPIVRDGAEIYIKKPSDCVRLLSVAFVDDCGYHPLLLDGNVPTEVLSVPASKSCQKCNSSMCSVVDSTITTRKETFGGTEYTLKTYYNTLSTGEVYRNEEQLTYDSEEEVVKIETVKILSCELDVLPCGCPKPSTENLKKVVEHCGCKIDYTCKPPILKSKYGYYNHKFEDNKIYLMSNEKFGCGVPLPDRLDVGYQTSADTLDEELIVPEYAIEAMLTGTKYYASMFKPNTDSTLPRQEFNRSIEQLLLFMYPFDMDAFRQLQGVLPMWG